MVRQVLEYIFCTLYFCTSVWGEKLSRFFPLFTLLELLYLTTWSLDWNSNDDIVGGLTPNSVLIHGS